MENSRKRASLACNYCRRRYVPLIPMTEFPHVDERAGNAAAMVRYPPAASARIQVLNVSTTKLILWGKRPILFNTSATLLNSDSPRETSSSEFFRRLDAIEKFLWSHPRLPQTPQTGETRSGGFAFPSSSEHERADFSHPSTMLISSPSRPNPADISQIISTNSSSFIPPEHEIPAYEHSYWPHNNNRIYATYEQSKNALWGVSTRPVHTRGIKKTYATPAIFCPRYNYSESVAITR